MTLNYSSRSIFPTASSLPRLPPDGGGLLPPFFREDNCVWGFFPSPVDYTSGWITEKSGGATEIMKDKRLICEPPYDDIADLLPPDPFGMGLSADTDTWTAAIAGWIEDLATVVDNVGYYEYGDYYSHTDNFFDYLTFSKSVNPSSMDTAATFSQLSSEIWTFDSPPCSRGDAESTCSSVPHDAMMFSLSYLDIPDLLSMERVCKTTCNAIRGDPLLWRHIHIDPSLSKNITDDALIQLAMKAKGSLECLSLAECSQITNNALRFILEKNPRLKKLNITSCTRLNIEGLVDILQQFKPNIQSLSIGGLYGITHEHLKILNGLISPNQGPLRGIRKPVFYHLRRITSCQHMAAVDVEECPRCRHVRVLYDCPISNCGAQGHDLCRACSICIVRCDQCGKCINGQDYEETFALDCVCSSCMIGAGESCSKTTA